MVGGMPMGHVLCRNCEARRHRTGDTCLEERSQAMLGVLMGLLAAAVVLLPAGASAQRVYRCADEKGAIHVEQGVLPAWCASQYAPVAPERPATPQELEGAKRYLERQLAGEVAQEERCRAGHEQIDEIKDDGLDSIDARADDRRSGRVSRGEKRVAHKIEQSAADAHARLQQCAGQAQV